jgi:hypothetical protein
MEDLDLDDLYLQRALVGGSPDDDADPSVFDFPFAVDDYDDERGPHEKKKKKKKQQRDENKKRLKLNDMNEDPSDAVDKVMVDIAVQTAIEMAEKETQTIPIEKGTVEMGVQTAGEKTEKETQTDQTPGITVACQTGWAPALGMKKDKKKDKKKKKKQQQQQPSTSTKPVVEYTDDRMVVTPAMAKSRSGNDRMAKKFARDNPGATWAQFRAFRKN